MSEQPSTPYELFSVVGLEIEYMLVNRDTLNVQALSDVILTELAGTLTNETVIGDIAVSNELVMHVLELKNNGPKPSTAPLAQQFQQALDEIQPLLHRHNLCFLPSGAHPWMDPHTETVRWPHGNNAIYKQYDQIFNCQGHGWANLQSMHINLPYANDQEFFQLHSAIRLLLPLLPALAASSPFLDGQYTGYRDARLYYYGINQQRIPAISGDIIPEWITSPAAYQEKILAPMYQAISPFDPDRLLQFEWLNSRGAIAKMACQAIEIRIVDSQECVNADIAIALAVVAILKKWLHDSPYFLEHPCHGDALQAIYQNNIRHGFSTEITHRELMNQWQIKGPINNTRDVWAQLIEKVSSDLDQVSQCALETILSQGSLSDRLLKTLKNTPQPAQLSNTYRQLSDCLVDNRQFVPE